MAYSLFEKYKGPLAITLLCLGLSGPALASHPSPTFKVQGVEGSLKFTLVDLLSDTAAEEPNLSIEALGRLGEENLYRKLRLLGYYQPEIQSSWYIQKKHWVLRYEITPNARVFIGNVDFKIIGPPIAGLGKALLPLLPTAGEPFIDPNYEKSKKAILSQVIGLGYLDATMAVHQVDVDLDQHSADIHLHLVPGPLYTLGETRFLSPYFDKSFLARYLRMESGQGYSSKGILALESTLMSSDYFQKVQVQPVRTGETTLDLEVETVLQQPNHYLLGAGYGTDTGLRARLGWERRYINRYGHKFQAQSYLAERYQNWSLDYMIPGHYPPSDQYHATASQIHETIDHQNSTTKTFGIQSIKHIGHWQRTLQLEYYTESFETYLGDLTLHSNLVLPTVHLTRVISDDPIYPHRGYRLDLQARGSFDTFVSSSRFVQFYGKIKGVYPLWHGDVISRLEAGTITNRSEAVPLSLRFFAGGDSSIRGYAYRSLGPTKVDRKGRASVVGGRHLLIGSLEYDHTIYKNMGAGIFVDSGNAMNNWHTPLRTGLGAGLHWKTPLGPLRVDLAHPLQNTGIHYRDWRFHISLGPSL